MRFGRVLSCNFDKNIVLPNPVFTCSTPCHGSLSARHGDTGPGSGGRCSLLPPRLRGLSWASAAGALLPLLCYRATSPVFEPFGSQEPALWGGGGGAEGRGGGGTGDQGFRTAIPHWAALRQASCPRWLRTVARDHEKPPTPSRQEWSREWWALVHVAPAPLSDSLLLALCPCPLAFLCGPLC